MKLESMDHAALGMLSVSSVLVYPIRMGLRSFKGIYIHVRNSVEQWSHGLAFTFIFFGIHSQEHFLFPVHR